MLYVKVFFLKCNFCNCIFLKNSLPKFSLVLESVVLNFESVFDSHPGGGSARRAGGCYLCQGAIFNDTGNILNIVFLPRFF